MQHQQIKEHMPVIGSDRQEVGTVDKVEGDAIKLTRNDQPDRQHHWIPLDWVVKVDQHVHLSRTRDEAIREWLGSPPSGMTDQAAHLGTSTGGEISS